MRQHLTMSTSRSAALANWFITRKGAAVALASITLSLVLCGPIPDTLALPTADEVLQGLQISDSDQQSIREGKIAKWTTSEGSDRELAVGMAFLIKTKPANLANLLREAVGLKMLPVMTAHGRIEGDGTLPTSQA